MLIDEEIPEVLCLIEEKTRIRTSCKLCVRILRHKKYGRCGGFFDNSANDAIKEIMYKKSLWLKKTKIQQLLINNLKI